MDPFNVMKSVPAAAPVTSRARPEQLKMNQAAFEQQLSQAALGRAKPADGPSCCPCPARGGNWHGVSAVR